MLFTISTAEMSPFPSVLWLIMMLACQHTCGIIFWDKANRDCFLLTAFIAVLLLFMLGVIPLHIPLEPDKICFDSVIHLWSHKPMHCGTLLRKLMRSSQRTLLLHHIRNQTFRPEIYIQKHTCYCFAIYTESDTGLQRTYLRILTLCAGHFNIMLWLLPCLWQINLDSDTYLLLHSFFITWYTVFN